jgi:hypothetical protein
LLDNFTSFQKFFYTASRCDLAFMRTNKMDQLIKWLDATVKSKDIVPIKSAK